MIGERQSGGADTTTPPELRSACAPCRSGYAIPLPKGLRRQRPAEATMFVVLDQRGKPTGRSSTSYTSASNLAARIGGSVVQAGAL